jgi:hypothetical protein
MTKQCAWVAEQAIKITKFKSRNQLRTHNGSNLYNFTRVDSYIWTTDYLSTLHCSYCKTEESRLFCISLHFELCKWCRMTFYGLRAFPLHWIQLHSSYHTILLNKSFSKSGNHIKVDILSQGVIQLVTAFHFSLLEVLCHFGMSSSILTRLFHPETL